MSPHQVFTLAPMEDSLVRNNKGLDKHKYAIHH